MATTKACDIYGTTKDVKTFKVIVTDATAVSASSPAVIVKDIDLSPRGLERLRKFIGRGTTKPSEGESNG